MRSRTLGCLLLAALTTTSVAPASGQQQARRGSVVLERLTSQHLRSNRIGVDSVRSVSVYLPPSYGTGSRSYPVIYYFHSLFWDNERMFADSAVTRTLDRAIAAGMTREFILVAANYSTPTVGSFYENSSTSGRWIDFTVDELVPFIDRRFRTIRHRDSRGLAGEQIGGYGAIKFAMLHPDLFSVVYALHPAGTGTGLVPMWGRPDWRKIHAAKSFKDLEGDGFSQVFVAMSQAFLPNPARPPFYADFIMEPVNGEPRLHVENHKLLRSRFLLEETIAEKSANLRRMRGIKFDWGRYDPNQDHVFANQVFTRKLDELGVEHEAEEYRGAVWDKNWIENGRVYGDMLPFFNRHLVFADR